MTPKDVGNVGSERSGIACRSGRVLGEMAGELQLPFDFLADKVVAALCF